MNMKNLVVLILVLFVSTVSFSQKKKITVEGDTIKVDGTSFLIVEKGKEDYSRVYRVKSLSGKILMKWHSKIFCETTPVNSKHNTCTEYFLVTFFPNTEQCDISIKPHNIKGIVVCILENNLVNDDKLYQAAVEEFVGINGMGYTYKSME
ncbi:hypothetical protein D3C87_200320 [compost metagenome]